MRFKRRFVAAETEKEAEKQCPWAQFIIKVEGGYMCFEYWDDYETWNNQV